MTTSGTYYKIIHIPMGKKGADITLADKGCNTEFDTVIKAHDVMMDHVIDGKYCIDNLKILEIRELCPKDMSKMLLSYVIDWASELREYTSNCIEHKFLHFEVGTLISVIVDWIATNTGYDLSNYLIDLI